MAISWTCDLNLFVILTPLISLSSVIPTNMLPPDELLCEELTAPHYENKPWGIEVTKKKVLREKLKRSPDRLEALAMTFAPSRKVLIDFF